jgi:RimJ/RimL family protein N-acetyltransferase
MDWLVAQLKLFSTFYGSVYQLFGDEGYSRQYISNLIHNHVVLIADDGSPAGLIAGYVSKHPYNPNINVLTEVFWWVEEKHRGSSAGARLLRSFTDWGKANGMNWIQMSLIEGRSPVNPESLEKRGFKLYEKAFLMEVGV